MVRRHQGTAFMGGAHVFPGGRVDAGDRGAADPSWCDGIDAAAAQLGRSRWRRCRGISSRRPARALRRGRRSPRTRRIGRVRLASPKTTSRNGSRSTARTSTTARDRCTTSSWAKPAPCARRARRLRALGDAADRRPPVDTRFFGPACRPPRRLSTTTRKRPTVHGSRRQMPSRRQRATRLPCRRRHGPRCASWSRFARLTRRSTGRDGKCSSNACLTTSLTTPAAACCCCRATRCTRNRLTGRRSKRASCT